MNIVYCVDNNYVKILQLSINLLQKYNKDIHIFVITSDDIILNYKNIEIIKIDKNIFKNFKKNNGHQSITSFFRLYIPYILKDLKKCIYLDCDIFCNNKIDYLKNINCDYIAGVNTFNVFNNFEDYSYNFNYVNAGVLILNLENLRKCDIFNEYNKFNNLNDQLILNNVFNKKIKIIDLKYNLIIPLSKITIKNIEKIKHKINDACLIHLTGNKYNNFNNLKFMYQYCFNKEINFDLIKNNKIKNYLKF